MGSQQVLSSSGSRPQGLRACRAPSAVAASAGFAFAAVALISPFTHRLTPPCPFHALTGLWCPLCGGTRAVWAAAHGDFQLMVHADALFPALVVFAGWAWLAWLGRVTGWWRVPVPSGRAFKAVIVVAVVAFTVLRNWPGFGALAPPRSA
jgi:hypothetical protein